MNAPAEPILQLPTALKGIVGLLAAGATATLDRLEQIEPALKLGGMVLGLCVSLAMLTHICLGIVLRWRKFKQPAAPPDRNGADEENS